MSISATLGPEGGRSSLLDALPCAWQPDGDQPQKVVGFFECPRARGELMPPVTVLRVCRPRDSRRLRSQLEGSQHAKWHFNLPLFRCWGQYVDEPLWLVDINLFVVAYVGSWRFPGLTDSVSTRETGAVDTVLV